MDQFEDRLASAGRTETDNDGARETCCGTASAGPGGAMRSPTGCDLLSMPFRLR